MIPVTIDDIRAAHLRIADAVVRTPTLHSRTLSELTGAEVFLKFENLQFTAAYKERGALNTLLLMPEAQRAKGVIAASAGNHAQALAYHGRRLGIPVTIVMPTPTPSVKVTQTEGHGARVVLHGERFDDAFAHACAVIVREGQTLVHPFDDANVIAGAGTVALEMLEDHPEIDTLIVPIGGGGLLSGMAIAARALKPGMLVVGAQADLYPSMYCHVKGEDLPSSGDTIAEGIAVKEPGKITSAIIAELVDDIVLTPERDIERAVSLLVQIEKTVVEGAGAAGLAAMLTHPERFAGRNVGLVLCGGNIDPHLLANVLVRDLARMGRIARIRISLQDRPGAMAAVTHLFHEAGVNILEIHHQRIFNRLPAKGTAIEIECEARDAAQIDRLTERLHAAEFELSRVELD
ncbi:threonine ammonia-lyase [Parasphingorhabdus sp.]|uniref:threonine ammonia-lyase n=1 Tax=Parasphingorhabdus sp. TaxID=2709688 RepID=UPI0035930F82